MANFGKILALANPAARNGAGLELAQRAEQLLLARLGACESLEVAYTKSAGHAVELAATRAAEFDTLLVLGGDGLVHETVNGLMALDAADRPALGVVPLGSGNDYARALGIPLELEDAVAALRDGCALPADVGLVNGQFFAETLSFGLDAAIALQTMELRKSTNWSGTKLYFHAGIDQLLHHLDTHPFRASYTDDAGEVCEIVGGEIVFAVQVGPTYGGGFHICPEAKLDDGLLDVCYAPGPIGVAHAVYVFVRAKDGKHTHMKPIKLFRTHNLHIEFEYEPPTQIDGEALHARSFDIDCVPHALNVIRA